MADFRVGITRDIYFMQSSRAVGFLVPLAALVFAAEFVGVEHFNGGVKTHHFLARADLPGFSNGLSLLILPLLGIVVGVRANTRQSDQTSNMLSPTLGAGVAGSLVYGAALAASVHFGFEEVSLILFVGLFVLAMAFPVYRGEFIFGFVIGMTITFGSVIPLVFALVFATLSLVVRWVAAWGLSAIRKPRR